MWRFVLGVIVSAALAMAADISGTWKVTVEIQGNTGSPTFVLKQEGDKLTGTYSGALGEAPVTGTVKGDVVEMQFESKSDQISGTVKYKGRLTGSTMKGTVVIGDVGEGTWEGIKS